MSDTSHALPYSRSQRRAAPQQILDCVDAFGLDQIAHELIDLLQCQIESVAWREFNDFTETELDAYEKRKRRILELRVELEKFVKPT